MLTVELDAFRIRRRPVNILSELKNIDTQAVTRTISLVYGQSHTVGDISFMMLSSLFPIDITAKLPQSYSDGNVYTSAPVTMNTSKALFVVRMKDVVLTHNNADRPEPCVLTLTLDAEPA